jgi:Sap, sulfolipid-1-addressing protein
MSSTNVQLIPYGLLATLSPLGFAATLAVIRSGRFKALGFGVGFVSGQLLACATLVTVGTAVVPDREAGHPTVRGVLLLSFGLAVLWLAMMLRRRPPGATSGGNERSQKVLDRLGRLRVGTALAAGLLLGIGGPKRLVLAALAAASITASDVDGSKAAVLVVSYTIIATLLAWGPILAFEVFGDRAVTKLDETQRRLSRHQRSATVYSLLVIGALALAEGITTLL